VEPLRGGRLSPGCLGALADHGRGRTAGRAGQLVVGRSSVAALPARGGVGHVEVLGAARTGLRDPDAGRVGSVQQGHLARGDSGRHDLVAVHDGLAAGPGAVAASGGGGQGNGGENTRVKAGQGGSSRAAEWMGANAAR
jgi:hypothetical protein